MGEEKINNRNRATSHTAESKATDPVITKNTSEVHRQLQKHHHHQHKTPSNFNSLLYMKSTEDQNIRPHPSPIRHKQFPQNHKRNRKRDVKISNHKYYQLHNLIKHRINHESRQRCRQLSPPNQTANTHAVREKSTSAETDTVRSGAITHRGGGGT